MQNYRDNFPPAKLSQSEKDFAEILDMHLFKSTVKCDGSIVFLGLAGSLRRYTCMKCGQVFSMA